MSQNSCKSMTPMILDSGLIYILDDESGVRMSLEAILSSDGYRVQSFETGKDLIKHFESLSFNAPGAALIDLHLPDISGVDVMKKIKERSPETEVILFTGRPDMGTAIESVNAGAYAYVPKPYSIDNIKDVLSKISEKQKLLKENRELTQKLQEWNKTLEQQVHQRTMELQESYKKLQALYEIRTQFITVMSHELRTPSTAIMGFADTLIEKWEKLPKEKIHQYLSIISNETNRLISLMSEIFELSRIQEGNLKMDLEAIDLISLIRNILDEFKKSDHDHSYALMESSGPLPGQVDSFYFKVALSYVISNAVKYTPLGGKITVLTDKKNGDFFIQIEDEGTGIPEGLEERIFEPFYRLIDDVNRKTPGAGLGLTISKGLIEGMGGTIRVSKKTTGGKGCAITITIPLIQ